MRRQLFLVVAGERPANAAEPALEHLVEAGLHLVEAGVERRLQGRVGVEALAVGAQQLVDARRSVGLDEIVDDDRALEVGDADLSRIGERGIEIVQLDHLVVVHHLGELHVHLPRPFGPRPLLLELRNPFREPARDALVRHLNRDDVGELVPEGRFPLELAGSRFRRVERHDTAETDTERVEHARQAGDSHREVVVLGKELDEDRSLRRELVARREAVERLMRERNRVLLQQRGLVLLELEDQIAVADGDELVERVQQVEHVLGRLVIRIELERGFERLPRAGLVAGAEQVRAEIGQRRARPAAAARHPGAAASTASSKR